MTRDLRDQLRELCAVIDDEQGPIAVDDVRARNDAVMPIDRPARPLIPVRRGWLVAVAAATVVLLVVGGLTLLTRVAGTESPVATTPPTDPVSSPTWSRVPHDEAVFGGVGGQRMRGVVAGGPGLVAVGEERVNGAAVWTSVDGITWSRIPHDESVFGREGDQEMSDQEMSGVTVGGPGLVAVGSDGLGALGPYLRTRPGGAGSRHAAVWTSTDGITWSRVAHDEAVFGGGGMRSVTAGGPGLVAVGVGDTSVAAVWTSVDGITWSRVPHDEAVFGGGEMNSVTAGGPGLVAVGVGGTGVAAVWTSADGLTWSRVPHDEAVFATASNQEMNSPSGSGQRR